MEDKAKYIFEKVSAYADEVNKGIDPTKVQVSFQLEKLRPIMNELSKELNMSLEDVFITYMDEASNAGVETEKKFQSTMGDMSKYGDPIWTEQM